MTSLKEVKHEKYVGAEIKAIFTHVFLLMDLNLYILVNFELLLW